MCLDHLGDGADAAFGFVILFVHSGACVVGVCAEGFSDLVYHVRQHFSCVHVQVLDRVLEVRLGLNQPPIQILVCFAFRAKEIYSEFVAFPVDYDQHVFEAMCGPGPTD